MTDDFEPIIIDLSMNDCRHPNRAWRRPGSPLAIHESRTPGDPPWAVTHVSTGLIVACTTSQQRASALERDLAACGDWTFRSPRSKKLETLGDLARAVCEKHPGAKIGGK